VLRDLRLPRYLTDWFKDAIVDGKVVRSAMVYPKRAIQAFKTFGVPRNVEREHASFYKPISIVRDTTVQLLAQLDEMGAVVRSEAAPNGLVLRVFYSVPNRKSCSCARRRPDWLRQEYAAVASSEPLLGKGLDRDLHP